MPSINEIIADRENPNVDFKVDASSPEKIVHDVGAFANTAGGTIIVGVDDDGNAVGVEDPQSVEATITQTVHDRTDPPLSPPIGFHTQADGAELVIVRVHFFEGAEPVKLKTARRNEWKVYERIGSTSQPVDEERVEQLRRERRGTDTFDQLAAAAPLAALDMEFAKAAFADRGLKLDESLLQTAEIAREINGTLQPTNAGLLLFGSDPQAVHQEAYFRCARYSGTSKVDRIADEDLNHAPLLGIITEAERFIRQWTGRVETGVSGLQVDAIPHYSETVIRELLVNAIAHADYDIGGVFSLQIFADRLEITNPGRWYRGMSEEQLRNGISQPRNRAMVNTLRRLDYVQQSGSAWDKAQAAHERDGYPLPRWAEHGYVIRVTVPVHPRANTATPPLRQTGGVNGGVNGGLAAIPGRGATRSRRAQVLRQLASRPGNASDLQDALQAPKRTLERDLSELSKAGLVAFEGVPKTGVYRLTEAGQAITLGEPTG